MKYLHLEIHCFKHLSLIDTGAITAKKSSRGSMQLFSWDSFFSPAEHNRNLRFRNHGQTDCCVIFLDTSTFSSDCYLCIFELAISPMHILLSYSECIMIVICPAIQHWFLTNIFFFFSITLTVIMFCPLYSSFVFIHLDSY